jgi:hypothetical protein
VLLEFVLHIDLDSAIYFLEEVLAEAVGEASQAPSDPILVSSYRLRAVEMYGSRWHL